MEKNIELSKDYPVESRGHGVNYRLDQDEDYHINFAAMASFVKKRVDSSIFFLYEWRRTIITMTALGAILFFIQAVRSPALYKTTATLSPPKLYQFNQLLQNTTLDLKAELLFQNFTDQLSKRGNLLAYIPQTQVYKKAIEKKPNMPEEQKLQLIDRLASHYKVILKDIFDKKNKLEASKYVAKKFPQNPLLAELYKNQLSKNTRVSTYWAKLQTTSPELDVNAVDTLGYINYTSQQVIDVIKAEQEARVQHRISALEEKMAIAINTQKIAREKELIRLNDKKQLDLASINHTIRLVDNKDKQDKPLQLAELSSAYELAKATKTDYFTSNPRDKAQENIKQSTKNKSQQLIDIKLYEPKQEHELYLKGSHYLGKSIELIKSRPNTIGHDREIVALKSKLESVEKDPTIQLIQARKDDSAYVTDIASQLATLSYLKSLSFDVSNAQAYYMDGKPEVDVNPFRPSKILALIRGGALGFVFAIFLTLILGPIRHYWISLLKTREQSSSLTA